MGKKELELFTLQVDGFEVTNVPTELIGTEFVLGIEPPTGEDEIRIEGNKVTIHGLTRDIANAVQLCLLDYYGKNRRAPDKDEVRGFIRTASMKAALTERKPAAN